MSVRDFISDKNLSNLSHLWSKASFGIAQEQHITNSSILKCVDVLPLESSHNNKSYLSK
uniref:Uncharacterized protein n=1 Tax=Octopus bimaculoides TaxID=37653 RepID=A0A0L8H6F0_OCTBM